MAGLALEFSTERSCQTAAWLSSCWRRCCWGQGRGGVALPGTADSRLSVSQSCSDCRGLLSAGPLCSAQSCPFPGSPFCTEVSAHLCSGLWRTRPLSGVCVRVCVFMDVALPGSGWFPWTALGDALGSGSAGPAVPRASCSDCPLAAAAWS